MNRIEEILTEDIRTVAVVGHVNPDGDCAGSVLGTALYLRENFPQLKVTAYLGELPRNIAFLERLTEAEREYQGEVFDLCISVDASDDYRIGVGREAFDRAKKTVCIDHHGTNPGYAGINHVIPEASSASEVLLGLFDAEKISPSAAEALFTGLVTDTGCFQYSATSPETLRTAAVLMEKGIDFTSIIRSSVTEVSFSEARVTAAVTEKAVLYPEGLLYSEASLEFQKEFGVNTKELGGVVSSLNDIKEADVTFFCYQQPEGKWKGSLRSKGRVDVAAVAGVFGGGGHSMAAGFSLEEKPDEETLGRIRGMMNDPEYRL